MLKTPRGYWVTFPAYHPGPDHLTIVRMTIAQGQHWVHNLSTMRLKWYTICLQYLSRVERRPAQWAANPGGGTPDRGQDHEPKNRPIGEAAPQAAAANPDIEWPCRHAEQTYNALRRIAVEMIGGMGESCPPDRN